MVYSLKVRAFMAYYDHQTTSYHELLGVMQVLYAVLCTRVNAIERNLELQIFPRYKLRQ